MFHGPSWTITITFYLPLTGLMDHGSELSMYAFWSTISAQYTNCFHIHVRPSETRDHRGFVYLSEYVSRVRVLGDRHLMVFERRCGVCALHHGLSLQVAVDAQPSSAPLGRISPIMVCIHGPLSPNPDLVFLRLPGWMQALFGPTSCLQY